MRNYFSFHPDLIVEATSVCDRACAGCYAPNIALAKSPAATYREQPELFLNPSALATCLMTLEKTNLELISIRGGEPSLHPEIVTIIRYCHESASKVMLETHGRWMLPENIKQYADLLKCASAFGLAMKVSFDSMHGLSIEQLRTVSDLLSWYSVPLYVAITEKTESEFLNARVQCFWIPDENIIFQPKAASETDLVQPRLGVVAVSGAIRTKLNTKASFRSDRRLSARGLTI